MAIVECIITNIGYAVADYHTHKIVATKERRLPNLGYSVADYHVREIIAISERITINLGHAIRDGNAGEGVGTKCIMENFIILPIIAFGENKMGITSIIT